jgi:hypothetical protein
MKLKISLVAGLAALGFASDASAQTTINITGATAFRSAAHTAIINVLGGAGVTEYGYVGSALSSANHAVFKGTIGGQPYVIRTSMSGSTAGIAAVIAGTSLTYIKDELTSPDISTTGVQIASAIATATTNGKTETAAGRFSFSDVDQAISNTPTPALPGAAVGVVPFVFVANVGAPAGMTNMTDQLHESQWSTGQLPLSMYTGNPADTKLVLNTGRNDGSGTRATILAETQYGPFRAVVQWGGPGTTANVAGSEGSGSVTFLQLLNNSGYSSNSFVRQNLARTSTNVTVGTDAAGAGGTAAQNIVIVSYLTLSDAAAITTITGGAGVGAKALTYNGVAYSENNVKKGAYTLWGYQQFYTAADATAGETSFFNTFTAEIPNALSPLTTGLKIPDMNVTRNGGDGGPITPN